MILWLLGYVLFAALFGVFLGTAIRVQGAESSCDRPPRLTASRQAAAGASVGERAGLGVRVAAGR